MAYGSVGVLAAVAASTVVAVTGIEYVGGSSGGIESETAGAWAGAPGAPSATVVVCAAGWPEVSDEADDVDAVSVESAELGLSGLVPGTVVVVTVWTVLIGSSVVPRVGVVSAVWADVFVCAESVELGLLRPVPDIVVVVTVRSAPVGFVESRAVVVVSAVWADVFVCAERVEPGLSAPAPETTVLVALRSAVATASWPEPLEFACVAPEVEAGLGSAEAIAPLMTLIRSTTVEHTTTIRRTCVTIMTVTPQRALVLAADSEDRM